MIGKGTFTKYRDEATISQTAIYNGNAKGDLQPRKS